MTYPDLESTISSYIYNSYVNLDDFLLVTVVLCLQPARINMYRGLCLYRTNLPQVMFQVMSNKTADSVPITC